MTRYHTRDGDMLDAICKAHYGAEAMVSVVLTANPGLADRGPVYPAGLAIDLPDAPPPAPAPQIRLWGRA